ncbi:MAG: hypothetical protein LBL33_01925 [Tannerella sp.]|nr:hypothetical protein [Tannerella sp.]
MACKDGDEWLLTNRGLFAVGEKRISSRTPFVFIVAPMGFYGDKGEPYGPIR